MCIPTYNRSQELIKCLTSLLAAGVNDKDIYIFDNNSELIHKENISRYTSGRCFNVIFNGYNVGLSGNLTKCLSVDGYDYIVIFEDHDIAKPEFISSLMTFVHAYPNAALIVPERDYISDTGCYLYSSTPRYVGEVSGNDFIKSELRNFTFPFPMCVMIKSELIQDYNLKRFQWYGDIYAWLSLALKGSVVFTNQHLYFSRAREHDHPLNTGYMKSITEINKIHKTFTEDNLVKKDYIGKIVYLSSLVKKIIIMESKIPTKDRYLPLSIHVLCKISRWLWGKFK